MTNNNDKIQIYKNPRPHRHYPDPTIAQNFYSPDSSARQMDVAREVVGAASSRPLPYEHDHHPQQEPTPREIQRPAPRPVPKAKKWRKAKKEAEFVEDIQARHRHNFLSYVLVFAFFGGLALILALNARLDYDRVALEASRSQLIAMQNGNIARANEIYAHLDLVAIEAFAIEHLGMMPPEDFQIMEVVVTPQSFFAASPQDTPQTGGFSLDRFWNILFAPDTTTTGSRE